MPCPGWTTRLKGEKLLEKLKFVCGRANLGIRGKLLIPTVGTLVIAIIGLSAALVSVQQRLSGNMRQDVEKTITSANSEISADLEKLKDDIGRSLGDMSESSGSALTQSTTKALNKQKSQIENDWEKMMMENGECIALLMARVAPNAVLGKDFQALNSYVSAALQNPNVIYAFYLRPDGGLLTRYIDQKNEKIQAYLKTDGDNRYNKILAAAKKDTSVMIVNKNIEFEGEVLGAVELCISKASVMEKIGDMEQQFSALVERNKSLSFEVLQEESKKVQNHGGSHSRRFEICQRSHDPKNQMDQSIRGVYLHPAGSYCSVFHHSASYKTVEPNASGRQRHCRR